MDAFRHIQQQAFKHDACLDPCHLEMLVVILRCDVLHAYGGTVGGPAMLRMLSCWASNVPGLAACQQHIRTAQAPRLAGRPARPAADVSHQAYCLLRSYLQRFPYARLERHQGGHHAGHPFVVFDTSAAWQPLAALRLAVLPPRRPCNPV